MQRRDDKRLWVPAIREREITQQLVQAIRDLLFQAQNIQESQETAKNRKKRKKRSRRQTQSNEPTKIILPYGARDIVQEIVANEILEQILMNADTIDFSYLEFLAIQFPMLFQNKRPYRRKGRVHSPRYILFMILGWKPPLSLVLKVYEACPEAISAVASVQQIYPLVKACKCGASLEVLEFLHQKDPTVVSKQLIYEPFFLYLLHYACRHLHAETIHFLLDVYPDAASLKSKARLYPMHLAVVNPKCDASVLKRLYHIFPSAINANEDGISPFHCFFRWRVEYTSPDSGQVFRFLLRHSCTSVWYEVVPAPFYNEGEDYDWTVTMLAVAFCQSPRILKQLLVFDQNQLGIFGERFHNGSGWLHVAAFCNLNSQCVQVLGQMCPHMLTQQDHQGRTPLHRACERTADFESSVDVVHVLLHLNPSVLWMRNGQGETPLEVADRVCPDSPTVQLLELEIICSGKKMI